MRRRLQLLFHNRYLDRPEVQIADLYRVAGTLPMVYGLGNAGAALLAKRHGPGLAAVDWGSKNLTKRLEPGPGIVRLVISKS